MNITCCIIDDEPLAVKLLESYVMKTPGLQLAGTYNSAIAAIDGLAQTPVNLIFCDIQMPDLNGLQFAEMIKALPSRIVFTTAYSEYAIEGWKADALHYLLKPIAYPDFLEAVMKAQQWFEHAMDAASPLEDITEEDDDSDDALDQSAIPGDSMFVKSDYKLVRIRFADILYVEGLKDYVKIYLSGERRPVLSLTSMRAVEAALPPKSFKRTHRSFIVNMDRIEAFERGQILFGDKHIPISDSYKNAILDYITTRTLKGRNDKAKE